MKLKINIPVRLKNPWFWVGVMSTILAAMGVSPEMFTSWEMVCTTFWALVTNPFQLGCVVVAVLAIFVDPTTDGFNDSTRALGYKCPNKDCK